MANRTLSLSSSSRTPQSGKDLRFEVLSLILFALAAFSLAALFSYHPRDPSFFSRVSDPNGLVIGNLCGKIGASLAAIFLQMFGMGGFLLPFALLFVAVTVYEKEGWSKVFAVLAGMAVSALAVTVFLSLQWKFVRFAGTSLLTGGILGAWISNFLSDYLNYLGATIVSLLVFGVSLVLCTPIRLARIMGQVTKLTFYLSIHVLKVFGAYCLYLLGLVLQRSAEGIASRWKEFRENKKETGAVDPIFKENVIEVEFTPTPAPEAKAPT
jgi:MFS family permease